MLLSTGEGTITHIVTLLVLQLAVILVLAKLGGELFTRYLKLPAVIGELLVGVTIGPFALGDLIDLGTIIPGSDLGKLFEKPGVPTDAISSELFSVSELAAIVLLFVVGLETNLNQFVKYARPALVIALGGVLFPFFLGVYTTVWFGFAHGLADPTALFVGAAMTATSVGITARVLSERGKLDTPEGVTILAAAVIDDILGILALTVAVGVAETGHVSAIEVLDVGWKAIAFLGVWFGGGLLVARYISRFILSLRVIGAGVAMALGLAFLASGLAESFGLAFIIGSYATGLALSNTNLARVLEEPLVAVYNAFVPIFFVVQGMQVDVFAFGDAIGFAIVLTIFAILGKVLGSGGPALGVGFNLMGAARIGYGMLPRGEVALIIAGIGLSNGVIGHDVFGVAIFMTIVTTLMAPLVLVPLFNRDTSGLRSRGTPE